MMVDFSHHIFLSLICQSPYLLNREMKKMQIRTIANIEELRLFCGVAVTQEEAELILGRMQASLEEGKTSLENYWIGLREGEIVMALFANRSPAPLIPKVEGISKEEGAEILDWLHGLANEMGKSVMFHSQLFALDGDIESLIGKNWKIKDYQYCYETILDTYRDDCNIEGIRIYGGGDSINDKILTFIENHLDSEEGIEEGKVVSGNIIIALREGEELIGIAAVRGNRPHFSSIELAIDERYRAKGKGSFLHREALRWAATFHPLHKGTTHKDNKAMQFIFKKSGGQKTHEEIYIKPLPIH